MNDTAPHYIEKESKQENVFNYFQEASCAKNTLPVAASATNFAPNLNPRIPQILIAFSMHLKCFLEGIIEMETHVTNEHVVSLYVFNCKHVRHNTQLA